MKIQAFLLRLGGVFRVFGIPADKGGHFIAGAIIALIFGLFFWPLIGLAVACLAAVGKEIHDSTGRGNVEFLDFIATALGGVLGWLVLVGAGA